MADQRISMPVRVCDGTTLSQIMGVDSSGNATVKINAAIPAGANVIGAVTQSGTWNIGTVTTVTTVTTVSTVTAVTSITNVVHVDDNSGSFTVDAPVATPVFVRLSDGTSAITTLAVSLASVPSHAVTNAGTFAVQATEADGANTTLGSKADAKSTATDTTAITIMQVLKQISASVQAPPSQAVTNAGTFAVQATIAAGATNIAKAEDVASADADVGVPALAVRKASPANTSSTDGDYEFLQISAGRLWCSAVIDTALPTGANVIGAVTQSGSWTVTSTLDSPSTPVVSTTTSAALAAGSSTTLTFTGADSAHRSKYLWGIDIASSVAFKAVVQTLANSVATTVTTLFGQGVLTWKPPHRTFVQSGNTAGTDGIQVVVTNLDEALAADVYASFQTATN